MKFDYSVPGEVTLDMIGYITKLINKFPFEINKPVPTPATEKFFQVHKTSPLLDQEHAESSVHLWPSQCLHARDLVLISRLLSCCFALKLRIQQRRIGNWEKLLHLLQYVKSSLKDVLVLHADDLSIVKW